MKKTCIVSHCQSYVFSGSLCLSHYRMKEQARGKDISSIEKPPKKGNQYVFTKHNGKFKPLHRVKAERVLGKPLPPKSVVHHLDLNHLNNKNNNLAICEDRKYHCLLHKRTKDIRKKSGN